MDYRQVLEADTVLDRKYRIDRVIGAGGFGITYQAFDIGLAAPVAVKEYYPAQFGMRDASLTVRPRTEGDRQLFDRLRQSFLREARTLAQFDHPAIVRVQNVFESHGTAYMVMRYESGPSLKAWLQQLGRAPTQVELDRLIWPLLDALEMMHRADFLHRDIAPDNVIVRADGGPVLLDFGASRRVITDMSGTLTGVVKQGYSPQEQYSSDIKVQGAWTDIYSLGATLYLAVTGKIPTEATARMLEDSMKPAVEGAHGGYRREFLEAIDAAMQLRPRDRPQTVAAWREMLFGGDELGWYPEAGGTYDRPSGPDRMSLATGSRHSASLPRSSPRPQAKSGPTSAPRATGPGARWAPKPAPNSTPRSAPRPGDEASASGLATPDGQSQPKSQPRSQSHPLVTRAADFALSTRGALALGAGAVLLGGSMLLALGSGGNSTPSALPVTSSTDSAGAQELNRQAALNVARRARDDEARKAKEDAERLAGLKKQQADEKTRLDALKKQEDEQARQALLLRQDAERQKVAAETARKAKEETDRKALEAARETARRLDEERQRVAAETARKAKEDADRKRAADVAAAAAAAAAAAEDARRLDEERQRVAAETARKAKEDADRKRAADVAAAAAAAAAAAEDARRLDEERQRVAAEAVRKTKEDADRKRLVEVAAAAAAAAAEDARRRQQPPAVQTAANQTVAPNPVTVGPLPIRQAVFAAGAAAGATVFPQKLAQSGTLVAAGGAGGQLRLWNTATNQISPLGLQHGDAISALTLSNDQRHFASGAWDGEIRIWDARTGALLHTVAGAASPIAALRYRSESRLIAVDATGHWSIIDPSNGQSLMRRAEVANRQVTAADISSDGRTIFAALADGAGTDPFVIEAWVPANGGATTAAGRISGHTDWIYAVAASSDGRQVASASADRSVRLWTWPQGREVRRLDGHAGHVRAVAFSRDGSRVAGGDLNGTVIVWRTDTGAEVARFAGSKGAIWDLAFSADGAMVVAGSEDGLIRQWQVPVQPK